MLCIFSAIAIGQSDNQSNVAGWKLEAPPNSVQLIAIGTPPFRGSNNGVDRFSFRNVSTKAIVEFLVDVPNGNMTGMDAFSNWGAIGPGGILYANFDDRDFSGGNRALRVKAIVYTDGSHVGSKKAIEMVESQMIGAALEIKRDGDILAASPDKGAQGLNGIMDKIGRAMPTTSDDALADVQGIQLPGVSQYVIADYLTHQGNNFLLDGIRVARGYLISAIKLEQTMASASTTSHSTKANAIVQEARLHAISDLTKKYKALSEKQSECIAGFIKQGDIH